MNDALRDGNGREAIGRIREQSPEIRVLQYSDHSRDELLRGGRLAENAAYVQKPFRLHDLKAKVEKLLDRSLEETALRRRSIPIRRNPM